MQDFTSPSVSHVREIIVTEASDAVIEGCIATASAAVVSSIPKAEISDRLALEVQRWLAAHFVFISDQKGRVVEEKLGEASIQYETDTGSSTGGGNKIERFSTSFYGRTAVDLDPSGHLRGISGRPRRQRLVAV